MRCSLGRKPPTIKNFKKINRNNLFFGCIRQKKGRLEGEGEDKSKYGKILVSNIL